MKRTVLAVSAGISLTMTSLLAVPVSQAATTQYVETNHGWVSYHSSASLNSPIVGRLNLGDKAPLVKEANAYWYEISFNGQDVYITTNSTYTHLVTGTTAPATTSTAPVTKPSTTAPAPATSAPSSSTSSGTSSSVTYVETNHGWVSYHAAASLSSPVAGRLLLGDQAPLVAKTNAFWYEIRWNNTNVYITTNSAYTHLVTAAANSGTSSSTSSGLASSSTSTAPTSTGSASATSEPAWQVQADKVIAVAKTQIGVPYLWGKQEPGIGFDCSNFTAWSYRTALGISFSGSSVTQRNSVGTPVALSDIREGDLLFFKTANNPTGGGHVGIYAGNGYIIQEGGGYGKVTYQPMAGTWFARNLVFARRVIN